MKAPLARVLAVEDHPEIGDLIRAALARARIEVILITTGEEALKVLRQQPFDLILLDIALPGISGLEVCRELKADKATRAIPAIFVTGQTSSPYKQEAKRLGAVDFIEKPFELLDFLSRVMGHLRLQTNGGTKLQLP
ncbi:MAG: response regulator [Limisphaerales bacterium]